MHWFTRRSAGLGMAFLLVATAVLGALPVFWSLETQSDFLQGEVEGLSIASDGAISLAPSTRTLYEATDPFFWSLVPDRQGNLYLGSGNDGKVYRIDSSGSATVLADTNELEVHGLAVDRSGNLYAGTSPRGAVYKIAPGGAQEVFFDPEDRYVWALAIDPTGRLLVATGEEGTLYRVSPNGQSETLFASQETHLVCLATDGEGNVYAGSSSNGLLLKVDRNGKASVLFDTPFEEVRAVVVDARGNVYAAAVNGEKAPLTPSPPVPAAQPEKPAESISPVLAGVAETVTVTAIASVAAPMTPVAGATALKGALYRVRPDGSAEMLWQSNQDMPLSLRMERDDRIMMGTGTEGRVFLVRQDKTSALLLRLDAQQVTSTHGGETGAVYFATANPARVYQLASGRRSEGVYRSLVKDTATVSSMGKLRWEARVPAGTGLIIQTRTGNSAVPDNTWNEWSTTYTRPEGDQITSPRGRFLQWRAILQSSDGNQSPELLKLTAVYLQQNLSPSVTEITIHPAGETFQKPLLTTGQTEILGMDAPLESTSDLGWAGPGSAALGLQPSLPLTAYSRKLYQKGLQTVTWSASDPNDDKLSYEIYYRAQGESLWKLLRKNVRDAVIAWDTVAMPDARYTLKIVATDTPSNPVDQALSGEMESRSFEVDNTPPQVQNLQAVRAQQGHRATFQALDESSAVRKVEYAVDSGTWNVVFPTDGISDSGREDFDVLVSGYTEGVHTLVVKVTDRLENVVTARVELR